MVDVVKEVVLVVVSLVVELAMGSAEEIELEDVILETVVETGTMAVTVPGCSVYGQSVTVEWHAEIVSSVVE